MKAILTTLCYIKQDDCYLMLHRTMKKHDINQDKWVGVGGHFKDGESPEDCLLREVKEETGLTLLSYSFRGIITLLCDEHPPKYMCLYTSDEYIGELIPCNEGSLKWIPLSQVETLNLWEGDKIFFPLLKENHPFFSLKLRYHDDALTEAILDGHTLELPLK